MFGMFQSASSFNGNISNWDVSNVTNFFDFMANTTSTPMAFSRENYDSLLIGWSNLTLQPDVTIDFTGIAYCDGEAARTAIINDYNWTFNGDVLDCSNVIGITNTSTFNNLSVYPNPSTGIFYLDIDEDLTSINLYDITGRPVRNFDSYSRSLDVSDLAKGMYFLELTNDEKQATVKLILQ